MFKRFSKHWTQYPEWRLSVEYWLWLYWAFSDPHCIQFNFRYDERKNILPLSTGSHLPFGLYLNLFQQMIKFFSNILKMFIIPGIILVELQKCECDCIWLLVLLTNISIQYYFTSIYVFQVFFYYVYSWTYTKEEKFY